MTKKKIQQTFEEKYYEYSSEKNQDKKKSELSLQEQIAKYGKISFFERIFFNVNKDIKLPGFDIFLNTMYDVILNYINKPGFSKADALRLSGQKLRNKALETVSASFGNKNQVLAILQQQKDKRYIQFQEVILETSLHKTLEYIKILRQYNKNAKAYKKAMSVLGPTLNIYIFSYLMAVGQWISMPYVFYTQQIVSPEKFLAQRKYPYEMVWVLPLVGINIPDIFLKIQFGLEIFILFVLPAFIIYFIIKSVNTWFKEKNIRRLDKLWNEYNYLTIARIKILQMKLGTDDKGRERYEKINYLYFLKNIAKICYERGLINIDWYKSFNRILQIFEAIRKIVPQKEVKDLTELFYNNLINILEAYKGFITGSVKDFNLGTIYNRFTKLSVVYDELITMDAHKVSNTIALAGLFLMIIGSGLAGYQSMAQQSALTNLISGE